MIDGIQRRRKLRAASAATPQADFPEATEIAADATRGAGILMRSWAHQVTGLIDERGTGGAALVDLFLRRAKRAGADAVLLDYGRQIQRTATLIEAIAYFRLLVDLSNGEVNQLRYVLQKFGPDPATFDEFAALLRLAGLQLDDLDGNDGRAGLIRRLSEPIANELTATGGSSIFQWLVVNGYYELDDPELATYVHQRLSLALEYRLRAERPARSAEITSQRSALRAAINRLSDHEVFVAGTTLLADETGREDQQRECMEFGTFSDLPTLARRLADTPLVLLRCNDRRMVVSLPDAAVTGTIERYELRGDALSHGDGVVTRWHSPFELIKDEAGGLKPADTGRYLDERFGNWRTPTLFFDGHLDAPNTAYNYSLDSLFALARRTQHAIENSIRFYADETTARLRDVFDIDFSMLVPQPVHPKVLSRPYAAQGLSDRPAVVIAGAFETVDAALVVALNALAGVGHRLVLAVRDTPHSRMGLERLTTVKTLSMVDHVLLYDTLAELEDDLTSFEATEILLTDGAGFAPSEVSSAERPAQQLVERLESLA